MPILRSPTVIGKRSAIALVITLALVVAGGLGLHLYHRNRGPTPGSPQYEEVVRAFYGGLSHLQVGLLDEAVREFEQVTVLAPGEPAAWANLGITWLRLGEPDEAAAPIETAASMASDDSRIAYLQGRMEVARGRVDEGLVDLQRAVALDPQNFHARFSLAEETERAGGDGADDRAHALLTELVDLVPDNLMVLLEWTRLAVKRGDLREVGVAIDRLGTVKADWPDLATEQFDGLQRAAAAQDVAESARMTAFLRNVLASTPAFQKSQRLVTTPFELVAEPFESFLALVNPSAMPSPPDTSFTYDWEPYDSASGGPWTTLLAASLDGRSEPAIFGTDGADLRRIDAGGAVIGPSHAADAAPHLTALDWNHDFRMDLALADADGLHLLLQGEDGGFTESTSEEPVLSGAPIGAWAIDIEMDGDLDLLVGVSATAPSLLRNNGDGTWESRQPFEGVSALRGFSWGDLDRDGDPDATLLDQDGTLHVFSNHQGGEFDRIVGPNEVRDVVALALGDLDADGVFDLVTLDAHGIVRRSSLGDGVWRSESVATWSGFAGGAPGDYRVLIEDLDNNGALDLVASGRDASSVWLANDSFAFVPLMVPSPIEVFDVADLDADGDLDMVALSSGLPIRLLGEGSMGYHWQVVRPRARPEAGDQRINTFGVGGEVEIRSGLLVQKRPLVGEPAHFGLGTRSSIDVVRIVWPNGILQAEFDRDADQVIVADQRLKGSCPWVFTFDGTGMRFLTDFLWRSPLGLRINAQDTAGVHQTEDRVRIRGNQLVPRDGAYDVRITAELWESHFIDQVSLLAVDHPQDVEVFVDERFAPAAPSLETYGMTRLRPLSAVRDQAGNDVGAAVAELDGHYLATFERGPYQGVATDHYVEFELPKDSDDRREAPGERPDGPWLIASGWVYPTDSSINVAIGQGRHPSPHGLSLEVKDEAGRWVVVAPDLGFPAGKNKTILIDLGVARNAGIANANHMRLRTNLEIYWDRLAVAARADDAAVRSTRLFPSSAELRYRGFSRTQYGRRDVPEAPRYEEIANVTQRWRDLIGYYTRFGEVLELVTAVDDRYVIMNAGDELRLTFAELGAPEGAMSRDFVLVGDGWNKDGDYNTAFSKTVQPLPTHSRQDYQAPADLTLESDPVFRRHRDDWERYHTRMVTPDRFLRGLRKLQ